MTLREHLEAIRDRMNRRNYEFPFGDDYDYAHEHAVAALAILDFKPLDSDLATTEGESYPPTAT